MRPCPGNASSDVLKAVRRLIGARHADHLAIARAMLSVAFFVLIGKAFGAVKEMAVAWRYGIGPEVDAYLFVFNLASWPVAIFYGAIYAALLPVAAQVRAAQPAQLGRLRAEVLGTTLAAAAAATFVLAAALQLLLHLELTGLPPAQAEIAARMAWPLVLLVPLGWLATLWSTWAMFEGRQVNTLFEALPAVTVLAAVLLLGGEHALSWGTAAGFAAWALMAAWILRARGQLEAPRLSHEVQAWPKLWHALAAVLLAQAFSSAAAVVDQFFAASLGTGTLSTLGYASRILALVLGLGSTAVGRAVLPVFARVQAREPGKVRGMALRWALLMIAAGSLAAGACALLGRPLTALLFERGAFTAQDTHQVAELLRYGLLQVPFAFAGIVVTYALHSLGRQRVVTGIALAGLCCKIGFNAVLVPSMGAAGLMASTALATAAVLLLSARLLLSKT
jgi:putative peptidoglycan lipid II flippase